MDGGISLSMNGDRDTEGDAMEDAAQRPPSLLCDVDLKTVINAVEQRFNDLAPQLLVPEMSYPPSSCWLLATTLALMTT